MKEATTAADVAVTARDPALAVYGPKVDPPALDGSV